MIIDTISDDLINMGLRQLGASSIKTTRAHNNLVTFNLGPDENVTYLYEVKENGNIYLQRVAPYLMMMGKMYSEQSLINMIREDITSFRNAYNSSNYDNFQSIAKNLIKTCSEFENIFLESNIPDEDMYEIYNQVSKLREMVKETKERSGNL